MRMWIGSVVTAAVVVGALWALNAWMAWQSWEGR